MSEPNDTPFTRVAGQIRRRCMKAHCCPNDGGEIPGVSTDIPGVRCFFCPACVELFVYLADTAPWRFVASYRHDSSKEGWVVWTQEGSSTDVEIIGRAVSVVPRESVAGP